jgi:prepilin-type N-terminal cleavage/methylation domain-containing protein
MKRTRMLQTRRRHERGFTLVELMVAMVAGLFVSMAVFTLAKHASGFAMRQSRIADATLQSVIGFERLQADIARAGFLSSPNVVRDPTLCTNSGVAGYPAALATLASVFIQTIPVALRSGEQTRNDIVPRRITLSGSYESPDLFPARAITQDDPPMVYLEPVSLGMANINYIPTTNEEGLGRVFGANRALRIVDDGGGVQFATIASVTGGANPAITLAASPVVQFRGTSGLQCGVRGSGGKDMVNVVNIIRYDVRNLSGDAALQAMYRAGPTQDVDRTELVREELNVNGAVIAGTTELIAELVVDLGFSLFVAPTTASDPLQRLDDAAVETYAGDPAGLGAGAGPQLIRAVRAWLSVRSQEADRSTALEMTPALSGPSRLRISLNPDDGTKPPFARVRTQQAIIPLPNQARVTWQ